MKIDRVMMGEIGSWVVVLCALLTTILVVRQHFQGPVATATKLEASYVDGWEKALTVGTSMGSGDAPVQVVEFVDFQCPMCARFEAIAQTIRD